MHVRHDHKPNQQATPSPALRQDRLAEAAEQAQLNWNYFHQREIGHRPAVITPGLSANLPRQVLRNERRREIEAVRKERRHERAQVPLLHSPAEGGAYGRAHRLWLQKFATTQRAVAKAQTAWTLALALEPPRLLIPAEFAEAGPDVLALPRVGASLIMTNPGIESIHDMVEGLNRCRSHRCRTGNEVAHLMASVDPKCHPTTREWATIVQRMLHRVAIDPQKHEVVIVRHDDTAVPHVHVLVGRTSITGEVWHAHGVDRALYLESALIDREQGLEPMPPMVARTKNSGQAQSKMGRGDLYAELRRADGTTIKRPMQGEEVAEQINSDPIASQAVEVYGVIAKLIGYRSAYAAVNYVAA
jgi:hypothetical protein